MKNLNFTETAWEAFQEAAAEKYDFKSCKRQDGTIYGVPDKSNCAQKGSKEVKGQQGNNIISQAHARNAVKDGDVKYLKGELKKMDSEALRNTLSHAAKEIEKKQPSREKAEKALLEIADEAGKRAREEGKEFRASSAVSKKQLEKVFGEQGAKDMLNLLNTAAKHGASSKEYSDAKKQVARGGKTKEQAAEEKKKQEEIKAKSKAAAEKHRKEQEAKEKEERKKRAQAAKEEEERKKRAQAAKEKDQKSQSKESKLKAELKQAERTLLVKQIALNDTKSGGTKTTMQKRQEVKDAEARVESLKRKLGS